MKERAVRLGCGVAFALLCVAVGLFLHAFMAAPDPMEYVVWEEVWRVEEDGSLTPAGRDGHGVVTGMEDGAVYRFSALVEDIPEGGYLLLETTGIRLTAKMDGETVLESESAPSFSSIGQVDLPFPGGAERCQVELEVQVLDPEKAIYPPLARVTSVWRSGGSTMAYANLYGIPAGIFALIFLLLVGIFLLGLAQGVPDFTLLVPTLAAALLSAHQMAQGCGYYFLPGGLNDVLCWWGLDYLTPALLLVWLLLGRRRGALRQFGRISLATAAVLGAVFLISLAQDRYFSRYVQEMVLALFQHGELTQPVYWLTVYLTFAGFAIAALGIMQSFLQIQAEARALAHKSELAMSSYRAAEESLRQTTAMRHEWKNQVAVLHLLQRQGDLEGLGRSLREIDHRLDQLAPRQFSRHFAINTILQSASARAEGLGVTFRASAAVPETLAIDDGDLCSLLFNLLDNAVEAAAAVPEGGAREVDCTIRLNRGYLAIKCENTYRGPLSFNEEGQLQTTKADRESHGFGLLQMRAIARKYGSLLDVSYTPEWFTVQTALKPRRPPGPEEGAEPHPGPQEP